MYIKDKTFKIVNRAYIVLNILLWIIILYMIIDNIVSLKYEIEKEVINLHINQASDYIKQTIQVLCLFLVYITFNILYLGVMGRFRLKNRI